MNLFKSIPAGIYVRWGVVQLVLILVILYSGLNQLGAVGAILIANVLTVCLVFSFIPQRKSFRMDLDDHSIDPTLRIANETLPYLRRGLNEETALKTAEIIHKISDMSAVAITDREKVLAYIGAGAGHHKPGGPILTNATKQVIAAGELMVVNDKKGLNCPVGDCPLQAAVIAPLKCKGEVAGTVKLYQTSQGEPAPEMVKLAVGIAQLLSLQMELAELDHQTQLVTKAELEALHAQINPHFLFNTLNTIITYIRTNPETARRLLIRLASFFRHALKKHGHFVTLKEEIEYVNTYLVLEKARFREKLHIQKDIDNGLLDYQVPVLTLQPLVENAVKHGIQPKMGRGTIHISARLVKGEMSLVVKDDGVGIGRDKLSKVLQPGFGSGNGVGLSNVHERLKGFFGENYGLRIESMVNGGTSVFIRVPLIRKRVRGEVVGEA